MTPFLSDAEVAEMCFPLKQPGAQKRHLNKLGLSFHEKPNGRPLVSRTGVQKLLDGFAAPTPGVGSRAPDAEAFRALINKKRGMKWDDRAKTQAKDCRFGCI